MHTKEYSVEIGGKTMTAIFSDLADQANGSVMLRCEDTLVMATAVISKDGKSNPGFFNLTVEYLEKFYAVGLILGGQYNKREGKPSDEAVLSSRFIDRTIRPLFDHHIKNAVQVIITVLSVGKMDPGILGINAASLALAVSDIPWNGPVGAVHIGTPKGKNELLVNDYIPQTGESGYDLDLTICGNNGNISMMELMSFEFTESVVGDAFEKAMPEITKLENWQKEIAAEIGKKKMHFPKPELPEEVKTFFKESMEQKIATNIFGTESKKNITDFEEEWKNAVAEKWIDPLQTFQMEPSIFKSLVQDLYYHKIDHLVHVGALKENKRVDLRPFDKVRNLFAQAGKLSPILHGTGIFYRGETHVLSVLTLGGPEDAYVLDGMEVRGKKKFMHHYNFPPYSAGETGRVGGLNRREMGHGMLAEKALIPVLPDTLSFPYTIRVVSESTASNGSTSQASICASSIALMDGGVPIKRPVAGIAMGLILDLENKNNYKILTDIQGPEDHHGDMDFKVAGTREGITAIQLDIKVDGVPVSILKEALVQAKKARLEILDVIEKEIATPRADISPNAPKIISIKIKPDQIGMIIGGGGKTINAIREKTGTEITIEEDGTVFITGKNGGAEEAYKIVEGMTHEYNIGDTAEGEVVKILDFGAFVKIGFNTEGLVHISEIAPFRVERVTDILKEGDIVPVKIIKVDERGRLNFSIREANKEFFKDKNGSTNIETTREA